MELTREKLKEWLHYDPETGIFRWLKSPSIASRVGDIAGGVNHDGYVRIRIAGLRSMAHRLVWLYIHGEWPAKEIDHVNGVRHDNRVSNLRLATRSENSKNTELLKSNTTGVKGVSWSKHTGKYSAYIRFNNIRLSLGHYPTIEKASEVVRAARERLHGEFANHG